MQDSTAYQSKQSFLSKAVYKHSSRLLKVNISQQGISLQHLALQKTNKRISFFTKKKDYLVAMLMVSNLLLLVDGKSRYYKKESGV